MQENLDKIKLVVALRSARAAVGWSQEELAHELGIAKTTIARMETFEGGLRAEQLSQINVCRFHGRKSTGPKTPQGRQRCAQARTIHGLETNTMREERSLASARLAML